MQRYFISSCNNIPIDKSPSSVNRIHIALRYKFNKRIYKLSFCCRKTGIPIIYRIIITIGIIE